MKRKSSELKALAREAMLGQWGLLVKGAVLYYLCTLILEAITEQISIAGPAILQTGVNLLVQIIVSLLLSLGGVGFLYMAMNLVRKKPCSIKDMFYAFTRQSDRFIIVAFIQTVIQTLCQLPASLCTVRLYQNPGNIAYALQVILLLLIGLVVSIALLLSLSLSQVLLLDDEGLGAIDSLRESIRLMKGNKGRLFYIDISFVGLCILAVFTLFIGMLWVYPYMIVTEVFFYMDVTGELDRKPESEPRFSGYAEDYWQV